MASSAACSCCLIASIGSFLTFAAVSLILFAFWAAEGPTAVTFCAASAASLLTSPSKRLLPSRYDSISSVVPFCPSAGPPYIQSTLSTRFLPPAASCICCSSWSCRSSARSLSTWSIFLRSSRALRSSSHTRFWLDISTGCHDFLRLRSPPMVESGALVSAV